MSKQGRLTHLMNMQTLVKVTNPAFPDHPWIGVIVGLTENPSLILDTDARQDSFRVTLPQAFVVEPATMPSDPPSSDSQALAADPGTLEQPPTNESPHLAAKYWRERQEARAEIEQLKASIAAKDDAMLTAMRNLVANDAEIKQLRADLADVGAAIRALVQGTPQEPGATPQKGTPQPSQVSQEPPTQKVPSNHGGPFLNPTSQETQK